MQWVLASDYEPQHQPSGTVHCIVNAGLCCKRHLNLSNEHTTPQAMGLSCTWRWLSWRCRNSEKSRRSDRLQDTGRLAADSACPERPERPICPPSFPGGQPSCTCSSSGDCITAGDLTPVKGVAPLPTPASASKRAASEGPRLALCKNLHAHESVLPHMIRACQRTE